MHVAGQGRPDFGTRGRLLLVLLILRLDTINWLFTNHETENDDIKDHKQATAEFFAVLAYFFIHNIIKMLFYCLKKVVE